MSENFPSECNISAALSFGPGAYYQNVFMDKDNFEILELERFFAHKRPPL